MKLCLIAPEAPPNGGIANWTKILKRRLNKDNIELSYINIAPTMSFVTKRSEKARLYNSCKDLLKQRKTLINLLKNNRPDIVHLTTSGKLSFFRDIILMKILCRQKIPCVYHIHFGRIKSILDNGGWEKKLLEQSVKMASSIITIDQKSYDSLKSVFQDKYISYIPNPIDLKETISVIHSADVKKEIVYVGWVIKEKGIEELISAWELLYSILPDYKLHIVGPYVEEYKVYLTKKYSMKNVIIEGEVSHEEALNYINQASIFILPSYTEGFPNVILEAMALKKSIIATNVGAISEMLQENAGLIIDPRSAEAIEMAIKKILGNEQLKIEISQNAIHKVYKEYDIEIVFKQYKDIWDATIRK